MLRKNPTFGGVAVIIIACVFWGTTGTAASFTPNVSPLATGAFAMGLGGVLLTLSSAKQLLRDKSLLLSSPALLITGGLSVAIYPLAFYSSMRLSGVAVGTVISIASAPFFTVILERLISKKTIKLQWMLSFIFGAVGILLLTIGKQNDTVINDNGNNQYWGVLLGFIAGLTYATYSWAAKRMIEKGVKSNSAMAGMFGLAACILLPSLLYTGDNLFSGSVNTTIALYMAIVPMFLGYICFGYGLRYVEASTATLITLLEPVIATLFAIYVVGEKFHTIGWFGMVLIGFCLLLQTIKFSPEKSLALSS